MFCSTSTFLCQSFYSGLPTAFLLLISGPPSLPMFSVSSVTSLSFNSALPCSSLYSSLLHPPSLFFSPSCICVTLPLDELGVWWAQEGGWRLKVEGYRGKEEPCCSSRGHKCHHDSSCNPLSLLQKCIHTCKRHDTGQKINSFCELYNTMSTIKYFILSP